MSKSSSVFVVTSGYYQSVNGAYSSLDAVKDAVLSDLLIEALDYYPRDPYLTMDELTVSEWVDGEVVNRFEVSCQGVDFGCGKLNNLRAFIETLDLVCVTQR